MRAVYPTKTFPNHYTIVTVSENFWFSFPLSELHRKDFVVPVFLWDMGTHVKISERDRDAGMVHTGVICVAIHLALACELFIPDPCQFNWIWVSMGEDAAF